MSRRSDLSIYSFIKPDVKMDFTAIDFETANSKRTSACSIGMAKVRNGKVVDTYYELLRPVPDEFHYVNMAVHGITPDQVAGKPTLIERWDEVAGFIGDDVLVAHSVSFEQSVINQSFLLHGLDIPGLDYLCTLYMSRVNYPQRLGYKLDDVCKDLLGRKVNHHHALEDAVACAELAVHHISKFREQNVRELIKVLYVTPVRVKNDWQKLKGIKPTTEELNPGHPLFGKLVVFTGNLDTMSRESAVQRLVDSGGVYQDGVTKATDYLVVGDREFQKAKFGQESSKYQAALKYNAMGRDIQILEEVDFVELLNWRPNPPGVLTLF